MDACGSEDIGFSPKATDHCKLLDKQEKERQKALECLLETCKQRKKDKAEVREAVRAMRKDIREERDDCNTKEVEQVRKMYGEKTNEQSRSDDGDGILKEQESRKRKRDAETEEHIDIDMLT